VKEGSKNPDLEKTESSTEQGFEEPAALLILEATNNSDEFSSSKVLMNFSDSDEGSRIHQNLDLEKTKSSTEQGFEEPAALLILDLLMKGLG